CTDTVYESRTRPCLLHQIKRCAAPCTGEISHTDYAELVREAKSFLSGKSRAVKEELAGEMERASAELDFERAAIYRDRLPAPSAVPARPGSNPRGGGGGAVGDPGAAGHQSARCRGCRRVRRAPAGRLLVRRGVLLPHRTELGQPRLL